MSDSLACRIFNTLVEDLRLINGNDFASKALKAFNSGIEEFRDYVFPTLGEVPVQRFKAYWQLQNFFKRYRFTTDRFTDAELKEQTMLKWNVFNEKRAVYKPFRTSTNCVLKEARKICREILSLPHSDCQLSRRNGSRASLGVALKEAYLDGKWADPSKFACPSALKEDLLREVREDKLLSRIWNRLLRMSKKGNKPLNLSADELDLVLVDKSWKILRPITPLSVFGLYWSFGLGGYVEKCLRMFGMNIRTLQAYHKRLAKRYSKSRTHVTGDLTSASDSLRSDILNRVLPRWFYVELKKTFIRRLRYQGQTILSESVLPMGNGATFPVETLVFYCLIKAIGNLLKVKGVFSVYGDDLIYPRRIHTYVCNVFADLGIGFNADKTFVESYFRESCGGDYYHGVDVRPALFPAERMPVVGRLAQLQYLYKILNSLHNRWDENEIPNTTWLLFSEIQKLGGEILQVPKSFPDTSGFHVEKPRKGTWLKNFVHPKGETSEGSTWIHFKFIGTSTPDNRRVLYEDIYLWDQMKFVELACVVPPVPNWSWGRYKCPGMTREIAKWYLKSLNMLNGEARKRGRKSRHESLHDSGEPRINVSKQSSWT